MSQSKLPSYIFPITIIGVLFFIFGFITWANSQLIPYLKIACQLTDTESYFVGTAFFAAYFFMSIPSSYILSKVGFKRGMSVGLFIMAIGALLFIPAAKAISYPLFLSGLFIIGTGLALLQTASNPYVTILGPIESAAQRISFMGVCNKLAGYCAVFLLSSLFLENIDQIEASLPAMSAVEKAQELQFLANKVIRPYSVISTSFGLLGILLLLIRLPEPVENNDTENSQTASSVLGHRNLVLGAVALFFYVGAEVISYDAFTTFGETLGYSKQVASKFAANTAIAMLVGYFLSIALIPKIIRQRPALIISAVLSIVFLVLAMITEGYTAIVFFALLGLSQSAMWPIIWPLALNGLGKHTKIASAILVMMIVGGAVLMPLMGVFAEWIDSKKLGFLIMIPGWLFLIYYALVGYKTPYGNNEAV
ncbi:MAG: sugar MFS transporter [Chitinophagales bacterium]|nr:sugar MFS transporter [Chitinophagales bacterium]MCZ2394621.1 sugar MFS transporter [Chitinophagales bacterium]